MADASSIRAGGAFVELFADPTKLEAGLKLAEKKLQAWGAGISKIGVGVAALGAAITAPLLGAVHVYVDTAVELGHMSARTGIAVEELSALSYVAQRSGINLETLETGLRRMQKTLFEGGEGSAKARRSLGELGLSLANLKKLTPDQQLLALADAFKKIDDPTTKAGLAMSIFGRNGTTMIPLLEKGSEEIKTLKEEASRLGIVLGVDDVKTAKEFRGAMVQLKAAAMAVTIAIGQAVIPAMTRMRERIMPVITAIVSWVRTNKALFDVLFDVGTGITVLGTAMVGLGMTIAAVGSGLTGLWSVLKIGVGIISMVFSPMGLIIGGLVGTLASLTAAWLIFTESGNAAGALFMQTWTGLVNAVKGGNLILAGKIAFTGLKVAWLEMIGAMTRAWAAFWINAQRVQSEASGNLAKGVISVGHAAGVIPFERARDLVNAIDDQTRGEQQALNRPFAGDSEELRKAKEELGRLTDVAKFGAGKKLEIAMEHAKSGLGSGIETGGTGAGTFSAAGAGRIGAGIGWQQLVDVQRDAVDRLNKIIDELRQGGARFA